MNNKLGLLLVGIIIIVGIGYFFLNNSKKIDAISVKANPTKTSYVEGEELDLTDGVITIRYTNGKTDNINMTSNDVIVSGYDSNSLGKQVITISYKDYITTFQVVVKKEVTDINIKNNPTKIVYIKGEELDLDGGVISVTYKDGTVSNITMSSSNVKVSGYNAQKIGEQTINVEYGGKKDCFVVNVKNEIKKISVKNSPSKITYNKGEKLDLDGGVISVIYSDGTTSNVDMTSSDVKVSGYNPQKTGEQTLTVEYDGKKATFVVTIKGYLVSVKSISIKSTPNKMIYIKGDSLSLKGGTISINYSDNTTSTLNMSSRDVGISGYNSQKLGEQTITVTYQGKSATFNIKVKNDLLSINIKSNPFKSIYIKGESLNLTGGVLTLKYEDGSTTNISMSTYGVSVTGYNSQVIGTQTLKVYYSGKVATFNIKVKNDLVGISIKSSPLKTYYKIGENLDLTGGIISARYEDNSTTNIDITSSDVTVSGFNSTTVGVKNITVIYHGKSTQFTVTVNKGIKDITIKNVPTKTIYIKGENLDLTGGIISIKYDDNSTSNIDMTSRDVGISGYDANKLGEQIITVTYFDKMATFTIYVKNDLLNISIKNNPNKLTYSRNESLDLTGGVLSLNYEDGTATNISMTSDSVSVVGYDASKVGEQNLTIIYQGKTTVLVIMVENGDTLGSVDSINIANLPSKTTYIKGEKIELLGGKIAVNYTSGTIETVDMTSNLVSIFGYDSTKIGVQTITVTYQGKTTSFTVYVKNEVVSIRLKSTPTRTTYAISEELDLTGGQIEVMYEDNTVETIDMTSSAIVVSGFDSKTYGVKTIKVTYEKQSVEFAVTIKKTVVSIKITTNPTKLTYVKGESLDLTGGVLTVTYDDQSTSIVYMSDSSVTVTNYNSQVLGEQTLTVSYETKITNYKVTVKNEIIGIKVKTNPIKITYSIGDTLDLTGGKITATFQDGFSTDIDMTSSDIIVSGYDSTTVGVKTIIITYKSKTTSFTVTISNSTIDNGMDFLQVVNNNLVDENGNIVILKGVNLGGWLVTESWMNNVRVKSISEGQSSSYPIDIINAFNNRGFTTEQSLALFDTYQSNYITEWDIKTIAEKGANMVRIPFWFRNFMSDDKGTWINDSLDNNPGFQKLDMVLNWCSKYGVYAILDMHGVPGGQNAQDNSGLHTKLIYTITDYQNVMKKLWLAISLRYKNNPTVAAYDIMNEPSSDAYYPSNEIYDMMIKAIRNNGDNHVITIESWDISKLSSPKTMGWSNIMYQAHYYDFNNYIPDSTVNALLTNDRNIAINNGAAFYLGEFFQLNMIDACRQMNISFSPWSYKGVLTYNPSESSNITNGEFVFWYSFNNAYNYYVMAETDSYDTIKYKWGSILQTNSGNYKEWTSVTDKYRS